MFVVSCEVCGGRASGCSACTRGERAHHQCPSKVLERDPVGAALAYEAIRAWQQYDARNLAPMQGGYLDQTEAFHQVCDLLDNERGFHERRAERHQPN